MKKRKVQLLAALCCVMMVVAVGCGSKSKTKNTNDSSQNQSTQTEQVEEKTNNKEAKGENSKKETEKKKDVKETKKDESKTEGKKEKHTLEGTLAEKKDFMFVVEDGEKKPNLFAFSEKPDGYDDLKVDDKVIVEYTGEVSEVDAFTGEVISVTKSDSKGK